MKTNQLLWWSLLVVVLYLSVVDEVDGGRRRRHKKKYPVKQLFGVGLGYKKVVSYKPVLVFQKHRYWRPKYVGWGWRRRGHRPRHGRRHHRGWQVPQKHEHHHHYYGKGWGRGWERAYDDYDLYGGWESNVQGATNWTRPHSPQSKYVPPKVYPKSIPDQIYGLYSQQRHQQPHPHPPRFNLRFKTNIRKPFNPYKEFRSRSSEEFDEHIFGVTTTPVVAYSNHKHRKPYPPPPRDNFEDYDYYDTDEPTDYFPVHSTSRSTENIMSTAASSTTNRAVIDPGLKNHHSKYHEPLKMNPGLWIPSKAPPLRPLPNVPNNTPAKLHVNSVSKL